MQYGFLHYRKLKKNSLFLSSTHLPANQIFKIIKNNIALAFGYFIRLATTVKIDLKTILILTILF